MRPAAMSTGSGSDAAGAERPRPFSRRQGGDRACGVDRPRCLRRWREQRQAASIKCAVDACEASLHESMSAGEGDAAAVSLFAARAHVAGWRGGARSRGEVA